MNTFLEDELRLRITKLEEKLLDILELFSPDTPQQITGVDIDFGDETVIEVTDEQQAILDSASALLGADQLDNEEDYE